MYYIVAEIPILENDLARHLFEYFRVFRAFRGR